MKTLGLLFFFLVGLSFSCDDLILEFQKRQEKEGILSEDELKKLKDCVKTVFKDDTSLYFDMEGINFNLKLLVKEDKIKDLKAKLNSYETLQGKLTSVNESLERCKKETEELNTLLSKKSSKITSLQASVTTMEETFGSVSDLADKYEVFYKRIFYVDKESASPVSDFIGALNNFHKYLPSIPEVTALVSELISANMIRFDANSKQYVSRDFSLVINSEIEKKTCSTYIDFFIEKGDGNDCKIGGRKTPGSFKSKGFFWTGRLLKAKATGFFDTTIKLMRVPDDEEKKKINRMRVDEEEKINPPLFSLFYLSGKYKYGYGGKEIEIKVSVNDGKDPIGVTTISNLKKAIESLPKPEDIFKLVVDKK